jgi:hypothetical protein
MMPDDEALIRAWIAEVVAEREACADPARVAVLTAREHKLGGLLPPAIGTLRFDLDAAVV